MLQGFNIEQIVKVYEKYFGYGVDENAKPSVQRKQAEAIDKLKVELTKNFSTNFEKNCFVKAINAVLPYLHPETEERESQKRAGDIFLKKPDYLETNSDNVYDRLSILFRNIDGVGINVYKTIYITTLTNGDLKPWRDSETGEKGISEDYNGTRKFLRIYNKVKDGLGLDNIQTNSIFEHAAATLIGHVSTDKIYNLIYVLNSIRSYAQIEVDGKVKCLFSRQDMVDGLVKCSSILNANSDNVRKAFEYLVEKAKFVAVMKHKDDRKAAYLEHRKLIQEWILSGFSILRINAADMREKEGYLRSIPKNMNLDISMHKLFESHTMISMIDSIPKEKMYKNAKSNIAKLDWYCNRNKAALQKYIEDNPYMLGMDRTKFADLLQQIKDFDDTHKDVQLFEKFLRVGKTLFTDSNYIDFKVEDVMTKLKRHDAMTQIDITKGDSTILDTFCKIFYGPDADEKWQNMQYVLYYKDLRDEQGYHEIRKILKDKRDELGGWGEIVKSPTRALKMAQTLDAIKFKRFEVENMVERDERGYVINSSSLKIDRLIKHENAFALQMRELLDEMRDVYNENKAVLGKQYSNLDDLYKLAVDYVEKQLVDIVPMEEFLQREVIAPYHEALKQEYGDTYSDAQETLFGGSAISIGVQGNRVSSLRMLNSSIEDNREDSVERDTIEFYRK